MNPFQFQQQMPFQATPISIPQAGASGVMPATGAYVGQFQQMYQQQPQMQPMQNMVSAMMYGQLQQNFQGTQANAFQQPVAGVLQRPPFGQPIPQPQGLSAPPFQVFPALPQQQSMAHGVGQQSNASATGAQAITFTQQVHSLQQTSRGQEDVYTKTQLQITKQTKPQNPPLPDSVPPPQPPLPQEPLQQEIPPLPKEPPLPHEESMQAPSGAIAPRTHSGMNVQQYKQNDAGQGIIRGGAGNAGAAHLSLQPGVVTPSGNQDLSLQRLPEEMHKTPSIEQQGLQHGMNYQQLGSQQVDHYAMHQQQPDKKQGAIDGSVAAVATSFKGVSQHEKIKNKNENSTDFEEEESLEKLTEDLKSLEEEIKNYQAEYEKWHKEFVQWQKQHQNHPNQKQFVEYQEQYQKMIEEQQKVLQGKYIDLQEKIKIKKEATVGSKTQYGQQMPIGGSVSAASQPHLGQSTSGLPGQPENYSQRLSGTRQGLVHEQGQQSQGQIRKPDSHGNFSHLPVQKEPYYQHQQSNEQENLKQNWQAGQQPFGNEGPAGSTQQQPTMRGMQQGVPYQQGLQNRREREGFTGGQSGNYSVPRSGWPQQEHVRTEERPQQYGGQQNPNLNKGYDMQQTQETTPGNQWSHLQRGTIDPGLNTVSHGLKPPPDQSGTQRGPQTSSYQRHESLTQQNMGQTRFATSQGREDKLAAQGVHVSTHEQDSQVGDEEWHGDEVGDEGEEFQQNEGLDQYDGVRYDAKGRGPYERRGVRESGVHGMGRGQMAVSTRAPMSNQAIPQLMSQDRLIRPGGPSRGGLLPRPDNTSTGGTIRGQPPFRPRGYQSEHRMQGQFRPRGDSGLRGRAPFPPRGSVGGPTEGQSPGAFPERKQTPSNFTPRGEASAIDTPLRGQSAPRGGIRPQGNQGRGNFGPRGPHFDGNQTRVPFTPRENMARGRPPFPPRGGPRPGFRPRGPFGSVPRFDQPGKLDNIAEQQHAVHHNQFVAPPGKLGDEALKNIGVSGSNVKNVMQTVQKDTTQVEEKATQGTRQGSEVTTGATQDNKLNEGAKEGNIPPSSDSGVSSTSRDMHEQKTDLKDKSMLQDDEGNSKPQSKSDGTKDPTFSSSAEIPNSSASKPVTTRPSNVVIPSQAGKYPNMCRFFPNCRYGRQCYFQHPECPISPKCQDDACIFSHRKAEDTTKNQVKPVTSPGKGLEQQRFQQGPSPSQQVRQPQKQPLGRGRGRGQGNTEGPNRIPLPGRGNMTGPETVQTTVQGAGSGTVKGTPQSTEQDKSTGAPRKPVFDLKMIKDLQHTADIDVSVLKETLHRVHSQEGAKLQGGSSQSNLNQNVDVNKQEGLHRPGSLSDAADANRRYENWNESNFPRDPLHNEYEARRREIMGDSFPPRPFDRPPDGKLGDYPPGELRRDDYGDYRREDVLRRDLPPLEGRYDDVAWRGDTPRDPLDRPMDRFRDDRSRYEYEERRRFDAPVRDPLHRDGDRRPLPSDLDRDIDRDRRPVVDLYGDSERYRRREPYDSYDRDIHRTERLHRDSPLGRGDLIDVEDRRGERLERGYRDPGGYRGRELDPILDVDRRYGERDWRQRSRDLDDYRRPAYGDPHFDDRDRHRDRLSPRGRLSPTGRLSPRERLSPRGRDPIDDPYYRRRDPLLDRDPDPLRRDPDRLRDPLPRDWDPRDRRHGDRLYDDERRLEPRFIDDLGASRDRVFDSRARDYGRDIPLSPRRPEDFRTPASLRESQQVFEYGHGKDTLEPVREMYDRPRDDRPRDDRPRDDRPRDDRPRDDRPRDDRPRDDRPRDDRPRDDRPRDDQPRDDTPRDIKDDYRRRESERKDSSQHHGKRESRDHKKDSHSKEKPQDHTPEVIAVKDLLEKPGRLKRPKQIVIIIRGPPGCGKTHIARLIKDKEVSFGAHAPRILGLDDYFLQDVEKIEKDPETGKKKKVKVMEYIYEEEMESSYRSSLLKSFNKTLDGGLFPMVIIDAINDKVKHFEKFWSDAKHKGFEVYIAELMSDANECAKKNTHNRTVEDIEKILKKWEPTPKHFKRLDVRAFLQDAAIEEVEMEEVVEEKKEVTPGTVKSAGKLSDEEEEEGALGFHLPKSKWDDSSEERLAKLDGVSKRGSKRAAHSPLLPDLDDDPYDEVEADIRIGKKRVRWADVEERKQLEHRKKIGFCIGTDWSVLTDPNAQVPD